MSCSGNYGSCCTTNDSDIVFTVVPLYFGVSVGCGFHIGGGYIVTAAHNMIEPNEKRTRGWNTFINLPGAHSAIACTCSYVGTDRACDIGVLRANPPNQEVISRWPCLSFSNSRKCTPGDPVKICGFPLGIDINSISGGVIRDHMFSDPHSGKPVEIMMIDASAHSGNSGSPILNAENHVVGVFTHSYGKTMITQKGDSFFNASNTLGGGVSSFIAEISVDKIIKRNKDFTEKNYIFSTGYFMNPTMSSAVKMTSQNGDFRGLYVKTEGRLNDTLIEGIRKVGDTSWVCVGWMPGCILPGSFTWHLADNTEVELLIRNENNSTSVFRVKVVRYNSSEDCVWCHYTKKSINSNFVAVPAIMIDSGSE